MTQQSLAEFLNGYLEERNDLFSVLTLMLEASQYLGAPLSAGAGSHPKGKTYTVTRPNGQALSVVIDSTGKVIERTYKDRADIHVVEVQRTITGWIKSIEQTQRGGRKLDKEWLDYFQRWEASGFDRNMKRELRREYLQQHDDDTAEERFNRTMGRYKQKKTKSP